MKAGAGNAEIRFPEELFPLEGFRGVHDLPKASVLIIEEAQKIAIVSIEIVMLWDDFLEKCREAVAEITDTPKQNVWIHVTHAITTPHAPGGPRVGLGGQVIEGKEKEDASLVLHKRSLYEQTIMQALQEATKKAAQLTCAKMHVGSGECNLIEGRDIETPRGWWIGTKGFGESNETMTILTFRDPDGQVIASLISYGMKPCVIDNSEMDAGNRLISADAPGLCCRKLEKALNAPVLYCTAAAGDRIPVKTAWYDRVGADGEIETIDLGVKQGIAFAEELAQEMAQVALMIIADAGLYEVQSVEHRAGSFEWQTKKRVPMQPYREIVFTYDGEAILPVEVITLGDVALVAGKPEINACTERQLQERSKYPHTLYLSMVGGGMKYMPDQASYERLSWEALTSMLMPGAAEKFVDTAIQLLEEK